MKIYTFNLENKKNKEYSINNLKNDVYNSYGDKYDWWNKLNSSKKDKTIIFNNYYHPTTSIDYLTKAFDIIHNYRLLSIPKDNYDFIINDIPVKIYDTYIQYGYDIIPLNSNNNYYSYSEPTKKIIIEIITKIKINK